MSLFSTIKSFNFTSAVLAGTIFAGGCSFVAPTAAGDAAPVRSSAGQQNRQRAKPETRANQPTAQTAENPVESRIDAGSITTDKAELDWSGKYSYGESEGETAGGSPIIRDYALTIEKSGDKLTGRLEANGFQLYQDMICDVEASDQSLKLIFNRIGDGNFPEVAYKKGDVLLTLKRQIVNGKPEILTYWGAFTPLVNPEAPSGKVYFTKLSK